MPTARIGCTAVNVAGNIYVCGGVAGDPGKDLDTVEKLDPRTGNWQAVVPLSSPRSYFTSVSVELMPYMLGGFKTQGSCALSSCERLGRRQQWEDVSPMNVPRYGAAAAALRGTIFVYGGNDGKDDLRNGEGYDPQTNNWSTLNPMPFARSHCMMVAMSGALYVFGGHEASDAKCSTMRYNLTEQQWVALPDMIAKRAWCDGASWTRQSQRA